MKRIVLATMAFVVAAAVSAYAADVKEIWEKDCAKCHGADGAGKTKMGEKLAVKDYTSADVQAKMKDEDMIKAIKDGVKDSEGKVKMKAFADLSDADIKALVAQIRSYKK
jgi:cytochrome c553